MFARVLQRPGVDVLEIVAGRVIERSRIREREIEAGQPQLSVDGKIRVVGQRFVDFVAHGTGRRPRNGVRKEIHEPRVSKFTTTPTRRISGWRSAKARAPRRPVSSPSVIRKMTSFLVVLAEKARASSSTTATPAPSSLTPGPAGTLS